MASTGQCGLADEYLLCLAASLYPSGCSVAAALIGSGMGLVPRVWLACALGTALCDLVHVHHGAAERTSADGAGKTVHAGHCAGCELESTIQLCPGWSAAPPTADAVARTARILVEGQPASVSR